MTVSAVLFRLNNLVSPLRFKYFVSVSNRSVEFSSKAMDPIEKAKQAAAFSAIDDHINGNCVVGIGSGSTIVYAVERLASKIKEKNLQISCVPTSFQAKQLIRAHKLRLSDLEEYPELDYAFDGADEVDDDLTLIKGGGGCLTQEKIVASCANNLFIIADHRKNSKYLGENWSKGIPIEVIPLAYVPVKRKLDAIGGQANLRMAKSKMGPVVTDNGNFIIDWIFSSLENKKKDWNSIDKQINCIPGVVETGLFVGMTSKVYFGLPDGSVVTKQRKL